MVSMTSEVRPAAHEVDAATSQELITHRRHLHSYPELSFKEDETARFIAGQLDAIGVDKIRRGVGGTGVVAEIRGQRPRRSVLFRAAIYGLPLTETAHV